MPTETPQPPPTPTRSLFTRAVWLIFIVVTLYVCYFSQLGIVGLVGPDEPRYAWIARDMAETGDFITPRLYGQPWFEKPPLYYWGAAVSFKLFGVSETAARLPSAIAALMGTLALAWLAWRVYGSATARWLLFLLPTTVGMIGFSHSAATDMPFAGTLACAMVAAALLIGAAPFATTIAAPAPPASTHGSPSPLFPFRNRTILLTAALFGFFIGRATLAKGPAALILCGGAAFFWAVFTKRWRDVLRLFHPAAWIVFCGSALPWYVMCAYRNPDFFRVFIIEHNFKRFLTPEFQHIQPFWFYGGVLLLAFLPWTGALLWAMCVGAKKLLQRSSLSPFTIFLLCWAGFCLVFFTISRSKLPGYILPAIPAIGLLLARTITLLGPAKRWSFIVASLIPSAVFATVFFQIFREELVLKHVGTYAPVIELLLLALAVANFLLAAGFLFRRRNVAILAGVVPILGMIFVLNHAMRFTPVSTLSSRYVADQIRAENIPLSTLQTAGIKRAVLYGLNFYLHTDLHEWNRAADREVWLLTSSPAPCANIPANLKCEEVWEGIADSAGIQLLHLNPAP